MTDSKLYAFRATGVQPTLAQTSASIVGVRRFVEDIDHCHSRSAVNGHSLSKSEANRLANTLSGIGHDLERRSGETEDMELPQFAWVEPAVEGSAEPTIVIDVADGSYRLSKVFGSALLRGLAATCYEMASALRSNGDAFKD